MLLHVILQIRFHNRVFVVIMGLQSQPIIYSRPRQEDIADRWAIPYKSTYRDIFFPNAKSPSADAEQNVVKERRSLKWIDRTVVRRTRPSGTRHCKTKIQFSRVHRIRFSGKNVHIWIVFIEQDHSELGTTSERNQSRSVRKYFIEVPK